jgi:hypothetical protein
LNAAWRQEVVSTYHTSDPRMRGGCQVISAIPARQKRAVNSLEENWKRLGAEIIHVDWTSAPGQVAAAPGAQPAPAHSAAATAAAPNTTATHSLVETPQNTAPPVPLSQDPRLAQIPSRISGRMLSEANANESRCKNKLAGFARVNCRCFAKTVLDYRIAHASDYQLVFEQHDLVGHIVEPRA